MIEKKPKVWLAVLNQGWIRTELTNYLISLSHDNRVILKITYPNLKPIQNNRNFLVAQFLKSDFEWLIQIDSDIVPHKNILDLVFMNKDIIGLPCPTWKEDEVMWLVMDKAKNGWKMSKKLNDEGLVEVDAVGTGAIVIKREVLEKVKAPFSVVWNEDGTMNTGLDFAFCDRAKSAGHKIYFHSDYYCSHYMDFDFLRLGLSKSK